MGLEGADSAGWEHSGLCNVIGEGLERIKLEKQPDLRGWTAPPKAKLMAEEGEEMAEFWGATTMPT